METMIADKMKKFMSDKSFEGQHGFSAGKSTVTQLFETLDDWTKSLDQNLLIDVLYIDIAKAFDTVSHAKLLEKLKLYGITGILLSWIKALIQ